jgi:hypothetical protein
LTALSAKPSLRCAPAKQRLILFSGTKKCARCIQLIRIKGLSALVEARRIGMDANFAVVDAGFTTKPAVMAVAARDCVHFLKNSFR